MTWVSPAMTEQEFETLQAIESGIPGYMRPAILDWIMEAITANSFSDTRSALILALKHPLPVRDYEIKRHLAVCSDDFLVTVMDWLLYHDDYAAAEGDALADILELGRSEWSVSELEAGKPRITKRIPTGVQLALEDIVERTSAAGGLLAESFNAIYGANPNPNHAYDLSVKAVETIACPKFLPNSPRATLGSVYAHLNQKTVSLDLREAGAPDKDLIVAMMRKLFLGAERHGSNDYQHVSLDGAKTALSLATALLSLLHEDVITVS